MHLVPRTPLPFLYHTLEERLFEITAHVTQTRPQPDFRASQDVLQIDCLKDLRTELPTFDLPVLTLLQIRHRCWAYFDNTQAVAANNDLI